MSRNLLTEHKVRKAKALNKDVRLADGSGLYLLVKDSWTSASWRRLTEVIVLRCLQCDQTHDSMGDEFFSGSRYGTNKR